MAQLLIPDMEETILADLRKRADGHGRTPEAEAKEIPAEALHRNPQMAWAEINALRDQLAATGRKFDDSTQAIREDRAR